MKVKILTIETVPGHGGIGLTSSGTMTSDHADMSFFFEEGCYIGVLVQEKATGNMSVQRRNVPYIVPAALLKRISIEPIKTDAPSKKATDAK